MRPRVAVLMTGGTIGSGGSDELDRLDYVDLAHVLTDEEALPLYRFPDGVDVSPRRFSRVRSNDAGPASWVDLRARIVELAAAEHELAGIVVTHGTASLEETAFFLHLTVPTAVPVVLVGAQRPPTSLGSDAPTNLFGAIALAASPAAVGHGVLVAMDDRILSARDVVKTSNHALSTFQARDHGALGDIDPYGGIWFYRKALRRHTVDSEFATGLDGYARPWPDVEIVPVWAGVDGRTVDRAVAAGARGLVVASLPPSMNPTTVEEAVARAVAAGVVVVQASRAPSGRVTHRRAFDERGVVGSDTLTPQAARILLTLCLAAGLGREETVTAFATY